MNGILNAMFGTNIASNNIGANVLTSSSSAQQAAIQGSSIHYPERPRMKNKTIFSGRVEVQQVTNGYVVHIASREGYEFDSHIAATIKDVNELIATAIVAFQLEDK